MLLTPAVTEGALAGITCLTVLELATQLNIPTQETILTAYDLYTADECFLTGTGAKLIPVREIDGRKIKRCPGTFYTQLSAAFNQLIKQVLTAMNLKPEEAIVIGDSARRDLGGAMASGLECLLVGGACSKNALASYPDLLMLSSHLCSGEETKL